MLVAVIGLFIVCVTPDAVMSTVLGFGYHDEDLHSSTWLDYNAAYSVAFRNWDRDCYSRTRTTTGNLEPLI